MLDHKYESEDDDFNQAPPVLSDDEDAAPSKKRQRSSSPQDSPPKSKSRRRDENEDEDQEEVDGEEGDEEEGEDEENPRRRLANDDDEEEDDDDEDDDDEDEDIQRGHRRKRRRDHRAALFDIEAEVDDEDEDEDDERDAGEIGDFIDNEPHPDDFVDAAVDDDRRHRELDARRELDAHTDAEEQAEMMKRKYGQRRPTRGYGDNSVVPRRLLLPSANDPGIWAVRCKEGKERDVVFSVMKRMEERMGTKDELKITAAFERGGKESLFKGLVYVEAMRQTDIMAALNGILNVYPHNKLVLVDIKDMPELFRVTKAPALEPGAWVRLTRPPKHADDLAQVMDVTENGLEARVRFIPRIDYAARREALTADGKRKRPSGAPTIRPPRKLYSEAEARKHHYATNDEFENGFQFKDVRIQWLKVSDVNPTLEEVSTFTSGADDGTENLDLKSLAASLKDSGANATYLPGDIVEVYVGEQKGVVGRTSGVHGTIATIDVTEGELTGTTIDVPVRGLRKRFRVGDHVKVIGGSRFRDEVGMVVKIEDDRATFLSDQTNNEVTVFSKDLREASDSGGQSSLGQYSLLDLVQLDPTMVGCIVKVDRETVTVLDQNGDPRQVMPSQIPNLLPKRKTAVAADRNGSEIRLDDVVREAGGQHRQGKIIHIHRAHLFLHTTTTTENSGVFVTRSGNVNTIAAKGGRITAGNLASGPDLSAMNPALRRNLKESDAKTMPPPKTFGRDRAIGQTVVVRKGPYKGLLGIVKDTTDTHARVELHTKSKVINVPKACLSFKDKNTGDRIDIGRGARPVGASRPTSDWRAGNPSSALPERTPAWGGNRTPAVDSGRTPAWKAQSYDRGNRTPAWADGSRTVNPYDGSRTTYGNAPRTPAWQSGARTPAPDSFNAGPKTPAWHGSGSGSEHRGLDPWGSGSKTPYGSYGASAPTPGASLHDSHDSWPTDTPGGGEYPGAPTPGAGLGGLGGLGAPTPAIHMDAPTPGAAYAPTPGAYHSAPTPGVIGGWGMDSAPTPAAEFSAPTPGAYMPETPAESGPRYADDDDE